jgi:deoxyribodipyrimidine photo-lyase
LKTEALPCPSLADMGFTESNIEIPSVKVAVSTILDYHENRNFPAKAGTSKLGIHLRFGTISVRKLARNAFFLNEVFLNELIWRDFYSQIVANFPNVATNAFKPSYEHIEWVINPEHFQKWCEGQTGYPIVDAGMRELNATGFMHNRVRMIVASFLTKHLLIDWRRGEAYFAAKLLDFDLASNNGGWQWAAGCGTDAAPYFRIFSPEEQTKKFDPNHAYIRTWVPEYLDQRYPKPIVEHKVARERCLEVYKKGLGRSNA